jgi:Ca2+-binding RTX toxin-like protein
MVNVEYVALGAGGFIWTTGDATVAAGQTLTIRQLNPNGPYGLWFNGAAETDGNFIITGGQLGDNIVGGAGNDTFNILTAVLSNPSFYHERVVGGDGMDTLALRGGGTISAGALDQVRDIEKITFSNSATSLTLTNALVTSADAHTLTVIGGSGNDTIDGSGVTLAADRLRIAGGAGADALTLGAGADQLTYNNAAASTSTHYDTVTSFNFNQDVFSIPGTVHAIAPAITSGALTTASFDSDLASAVDASHLGAHDAVLFTPNSGSLAGQTFLVVDLDGHAGYQANDDLVIRLVNFTGTMHVADFI